MSSTQTSTVHDDGSKRKIIMTVTWNDSDKSPSFPLTGGVSGQAPDMVSQYIVTDPTTDAIMAGIQTTFDTANDEVDFVATVDTGAITGLVTKHEFVWHVVKKQDGTSITP